MMGGNISVESQVGQGSTFLVRLPKNVEPMAVKRSTSEILERVEAEIPSNGSGTQNTVLVIDDDENSRDLITHYLQQSGFEVVSASNGADGIQIAKDIVPAVITLDVMMPEMDGWAVLNTLKADPNLSRVPVIMVTFVHDKNMGYALGASEYLTKPIDKKKFAEILSKYKCSSRPCEILVVEDDDNTRSLMVDTLTAEGWEIVEARNGREALQCLDVTKPELILLDLMMPEMDGFEFMEVIRQHEQYKHIPVIVVTAMDLSHDDRNRLNGYVRQVLQKGSVSQSTLLEEIQTLVQACLTTE